MNTFDQIHQAYKLMASKARYRPAAPSDGFGRITVPIDQLNLNAEAEEYATSWRDQEDDATFLVGTCDFQTREATIFTIEAARNMCAGRLGDATALKLLRMAVTSLESAMKADKAA
jgi:hypothetical protein